MMNNKTSQTIRDAVDKVASMLEDQLEAIIDEDEGYREARENVIAHLPRFAEFMDKMGSEEFPTDKIISAEIAIDCAIRHELGMRLLRGSGTKLLEDAVADEREQR